MKALLLVFFGTLFASLTLAQNQSERLTFESLTFPGHLWTPFMPPPAEGKPTTVSGVLTLPAGTNKIPAVVLVHGCGGISGAEANWSTRLVEFGLATFLVNGFAAREVSEVCSGRYSINIASVLSDAYRALGLLATHPRIDPSRIAIMGFSFGGRTALWTSHPRFAERYGQASLKFAAHLAFYPASCYIQLADEAQIGSAPLRIFHGSADDWTPIGPCRQFVRRLQSAGKDAALIEYAGAPHSFDNPWTQSLKLPEALSPANCTFVEREGKMVDSATGREAAIDAPCVFKGVSVGYHPEAHRQAIQDVHGFLKTIFGLK